MDANTLTKMQVRKTLKTHCVPFKKDDSNDDVGVLLTGAGKAWQLEIFGNSLATDVQRILPNVGGYTTGYGSLVLKPNYEDRGDFNDKSSRHHY